MEQFATEEQQVEAIKRFAKEYGIPILVGAVIGFGGLWGWRYYDAQQLSSQEAASAGYQKAVEAIVANTDDLSTATEFVNANPDSGYSLLTSLLLAKDAVERKDLDAAVKHLSFVATNSQDVAIQSIANLRLARVQTEQEAYDSALATLDKVTDEAFVAQVQEYKGDVFVKQALFDKARASYSAALEKNANNNMVKMKLDNLAVAANG